VHICNPSTQETEVGGLEFNASLSCIANPISNKSFSLCGYTTTYILVHLFYVYIKKDYFLKFNFVL
jgi:hypothetical protein